MAIKQSTGKKFGNRMYVREPYSMNLWAICSMMCDRYKTWEENSCTIFVLTGVNKISNTAMVSTAWSIRNIFSLLLYWISWNLSFNMRPARRNRFSADQMIDWPTQISILTIKIQGMFNGNKSIFMKATTLFINWSPQKNLNLPWSTSGYIIIPFQIDLPNKEKLFKNKLHR